MFYVLILLPGKLDLLVELWKHTAADGHRKHQPGEKVISWCMYIYIRLLLEYSQTATGPHTTWLSNAQLQHHQRYSGRKALRVKNGWCSVRVCLNGVWCGLRNCRDEHMLCVSSAVLRCVCNVYMYKYATPTRQKCWAGFKIFDCEGVARVVTNCWKYE